MAENFTNARVTNLVLAGQTIYTVPTTTTSVIVGFRISNKHTSEITVNATLAGTSIIGDDTVIPLNSSLEVLETSKMVLLTGETIQVTPSVDAVVDVVLSILEITTV